MKKKYDVSALGELLIDFTTDSVQEDGYPIMAAHPGGAPANFLAPIAKYGKAAALIAKVGSDDFGKMLCRTIEEAGISTDGIETVDDAFTTLAFVTRTPNGERSFSFARKPGADMLLSVTPANTAVVENSAVVHFGSVGMTDEPARSTHRELVQRAKASGAIISYDPNFRPPLWMEKRGAAEQMLWGISVADVVKISDSETDFIYGVPPEEAMKKILADNDVKLVFVTLGPDGCIYSDGKHSGRAAAPKGIRPLDTTGAGDIFAGSAIYGMLETGKRPEELSAEELRSIAAFACAAASISTEALGAIPSVPKREDVLALLGRDGPVCPKSFHGRSIS